MLIRAGKFLLVGTLVTAIHLAIAYLLVHFSCPLLWANGIAFGIAFFISYFLQSRITFEHHYSLDKLAKYALVALIAFIASQAVACLSLQLLIPIKWAVLLSGLTPPGISFFLNYFFVFGKNKKQT
ncbi:MAG: GtrA family protein [Arenimonas sp.]